MARRSELSTGTSIVYLTGPSSCTMLCSTRTILYRMDNTPSYCKTDERAGSLRVCCLTTSSIQRQFPVVRSPFTANSLKYRNNDSKASGSSVSSVIPDSTKSCSPTSSLPHDEGPKVSTQSTASTGASVSPPHINKLTKDLIVGTTLFVVGILAVIGYVVWRRRRGRCSQVRPLKPGSYSTNARGSGGYVDSEESWGIDMPGDAVSAVTSTSSVRSSEKPAVGDRLPPLRLGSPVPSVRASSHSTVPGRSTQASALSSRVSASVYNDATSNVPNVARSMTPSHPSSETVSRSSSIDVDPPTSLPPPSYKSRHSRSRSGWHTMFSLGDESTWSFQGSPETPLPRYPTPQSPSPHASPNYL